MEAIPRPKQLVVCAAIRSLNGDIVCSARHMDPLMRIMMEKFGDRSYWRNNEQGFIDQFGEFLTREQALAIATEQKQIRRRCGGDDKRLYSENLY